MTFAAFRTQQSFVFLSLALTYRKERPTSQSSSGMLLIECLSRQLHRVNSVNITLTIIVKHDNKIVVNQ